MNGFRLFVLLCMVCCACISGYHYTVQAGGKEDTMQKPDAGDGGVLSAHEVAITVIYDNRAFIDGCEAAWGFSCLVTGAERCVLFDTGGDGEILMRNMDRVGIDPDTVDVIVLSHAHWDHTGGLERFLEANGDVEIVSPIGFTGELRKMAPDPEDRIIEPSGWLEICGGLYSTGELGRAIPEQSLVVRTDRGLIVITGCAHPGIVEILKHVEKRFDEDILFVMGGFHLMNESTGGLGRIIDDFRTLRVEYAAPCHCSGDKAIALFAEEYGDHFVEIGAGRKLMPGDFE